MLTAEMPFLNERKARLHELLEEARGVLDENWLGSSTKPAPDLYPHQWNWDSGFIAIGYARERPERAVMELSSLFNAQWENGMVPQIVFNEDALGNYFPEPNFWQCDRSEKAPDHVPTSGITQPPVHAIAAKHVFEHADPSSSIRDALRTLLPSLKQSHLYFYRERDPQDEGLVYIRHPWESGLDNSPAWDPPLRHIDLDQVSIPTYTRRDLERNVPEDQRPDDETYDRYVHLVDLFRLHDYDEEAIRSACPFLVQDPMFNAILSRANQALIDLCRSFDVPCDELIERDRQTRRAIRTKLWHEEKNHFDPYDLVADAPVDVQTSADFFPMYDGSASDEQAEELYNHLESNSFCSMHEDTCFSVPNYNMQGDRFDPDNYWRGPVWINVNWMLMHGLRRYGFDQKARAVREDLVELIHRNGFSEYFDPYQGTGYGTDRFSWSAALFIDVAHEILEEIEAGTYPDDPSFCGGDADRT